MQNKLTIRRSNDEVLIKREIDRGYNLAMADTKKKEHL